MTEPNDNVTELLLRWGSGDKTAQDKLIVVVYEDLRKRAKQYLRHERTDHTLEPTALVHEAYVRLIKQDRVSWQNRAHFFAVAAQMMRRVLVDHARSHRAKKRGEGFKFSIEEMLNIPIKQDLDLVKLDDVLSNLSTFDSRQSQIVELRFFGGLSVEETSEILNISVSTVMREWKIAKMWLYKELNKSEIVG